ncbi:hypothetical protein TRIUR3_28522 [Triticum urartu]|uniref:Uncharacterized protein n=1 Tax=Triticum urartu TaxID=4572 RepID=M8A5L6_TRIUA|nr:hypothetical protein TRIUR3_28522 [Triticum urartu]
MPSRRERRRQRRHRRPWQLTESRFSPRSVRRSSLKHLVHGLPPSLPGTGRKGSRSPPPNRSWHNHDAYSRHRTHRIASYTGRSQSHKPPPWWEHLITTFRNIIGNHAISCIRSIRNDIEQCAATGCLTASRNNTANQNDGRKDEISASPSHHIQQCGKRRLKAELLSLVAAIRPTNKLEFAEVLISQLRPDRDAPEKLGVRLKKIVEDNMYADCHGVPLKPLLSVLAKNAEDVLTQRKQALVQAQAISNAPAGVSAP